MERYDGGIEGGMIDGGIEGGILWRNREMVLYYFGYYILPIIGGFSSFNRL
jgi:hypothetical protein